MIHFPTSRTRLSNYTCVILMMTFLVLQFTPFWTYNEHDQLSIMQYTLNVEKRGELIRFLENEIEDIHIFSQIWLLPVIQSLLCITGTIKCIRNSDDFHARSLPAICGMIGAISYLSIPMLQINTPWETHLALCLLMVIVSVTNPTLSSEAKDAVFPSIL